MAMRMWNLNKKLNSEPSSGEGTKMGNNAPATAGKKIYLAVSDPGEKEISTHINTEANQNIQAIAVEKPNCIPVSENHPGSNAPPKLNIVIEKSKCFTK